MGRLGTLVYVVTMLAPLGARAETHTYDQQGMCSELSSFDDGTTRDPRPGGLSEPGTDPTTAQMQSLATPGAATERWATWVPLASELEQPSAPSPEPVLWCLTPDDPRCSPIDHAPEGRRLSGIDHGRTSAQPQVQRAPRITITHPRSLAGGPRSAHSTGLERPPRA